MALRRGWKSLALCLTTGLSLAASLPAHAQDTQPVPEERVYVEKFLDKGDGWTLRNVSGYTVDDKGDYYSRDVYTVSTRDAVFQLPLSKNLQAEMAAEFDQKGSEGLTLSVDKRIADEIALSEDQGELTPYLKEIAQPTDDGGKTVNGMQLFGGCSDTVSTRSKSFTLNTPLNLSQGFGGGFSGSLTSTGTITGSATGEVVTVTKRFKLLFACIPYLVKFDHAHAYGNAQVSSGATVNGTLNYNFSWQTELAKPYLGSVDFMAGPIPVHIGFNLPINLGLDINASVTGSVSYNGQQTATGSFDYTCTLSSCWGSAGYNLGSAPTPQPVTGSVSGRIYPTLWAQVAVRAYLYSEWIAYAQVGVKPYLYGDLWGYYGNTCGDADGDGINETVSALTFDLDWQLFITARASAVGYSHDWSNLWSTSRRHIRFWDLVSGGSSALRPTLLGPSPTAVNYSTNYSSRMRPCWPYADTVNSQFAWGDATYASYSAAPSTPTTKTKYWTTVGAKTVQATALSDAHGRTLSATTPRTIQVTNPTWTAWINRDAPGGAGDYETLVDIRNEGYAVCANPVGIDCQTTSGTPWNSTGQVYSCSVSTGGVCVNAQQSSGSCLDYKVRFLCP